MEERLVIIAAIPSNVRKTAKNAILGTTSAPEERK